MTDQTEHSLPELLDIEPRIKPPVDPGFRPVILAHKNYKAAVEKSGLGLPVRIAVERESGLVSIYETRVLHVESASLEATRLFVERIVKFLLWSRGGWKIYFQGPGEIGRYIRDVYAAGGPRSFDVELMGHRVYDREFSVVLSGEKDFPSPKNMGTALGGNLEGCRIGFDLGASDYKVAAVKDGDPVFSEEIPWNPQQQPDPQYHYDHIRSGLKKAASRLPRVDAIGGSSAGIYINNQVRIASLFRAIPVDVFENKVKGMFLEMKKEWGVPFEVINDGEVTALAGTMSFGDTAMLGTAMGSSLAGGYLNTEGHIPGWLDELAFAPVDISPSAAVDEWSGDRGVGAMYFSQQAVNKLALLSGFQFPESQKLPDRLKHVQELAEKGDDRAGRIFESIGVYLGYTIPYYAEFYDFRNLMVLGRVMSGVGGDKIVETAKKVLSQEFADLAGRITIHLTDEKSRRVGQAVAAASLPEIK